MINRKIFCKLNRAPGLHTGWSEVSVYIAICDLHVVGAYQHVKLSHVFVIPVIVT